MEEQEVGRILRKGFYLRTNNAIDEIGFTPFHARLWVLTGFGACAREHQPCARAAADNHDLSSSQGTRLTV